MIQYNYKLHWSAADQGFENKLEKVMQTLCMRPASKQANAIFIQLSFCKMPGDEAWKIREKIRDFLPRAVVAGMTETLFSDTQQEGYVQMNCSFFQNAKLRLLEYSGVPEDFSRLGVEFGQKVAAMPDARAALVLGSTENRFPRFLDGFVCGNENVVVFGSTTGAISHGDEESSIVTEDIIATRLGKPYLMGNAIMDHGVVVVAFCGESLSVRADYVLGWKPLGKEMVITETLGPNVISTLDGMPAVDIYRHYLKVIPDENFVYNIAEFPLTMERNGCLIARVPPGYDEEGRIFFNGDVRVGERVRLTYAVREDFLHETELASEKMSQFAPEGLYITACGTRSFFLQGDEFLETRYYQRIANQLNICSGTGEIYCYQGQGGLLNCALIAVGFREGGSKSALNIFDAPLEVQDNKRMLLSTRMAAFLDVITKELEASNRELKELATKNEEASIDKYKFLANASRELAGPLKEVISLERKIRKESTEKRIQKYAQDCHIAGGKILNIITGIFDFLEMEAGDFVINEAEYKFSALLEHLQEEILDEAEEKGLDVVIDLPPNLPSVLYGDELRLRQILVNVLSNSVKFTEKGSIRMQIAMEKKSSAEVLLHIVVQDTGIGIAPETFAEVQKILAGDEGRPNSMLIGTGLGLNVTQRLLKLFASELHMESEPGKGTSCSFDLCQRVLNWMPMKRKNKQEPTETTEEKPSIRDEELHETWDALREIATAKDRESLVYMLENLAGYRLPDRDAELLLELQTAAQEENWDQIQRLVQ
ncbi:MAG: FIST C-terminal domain-containing protein [Selenomonas sp.]|uniref:ATP-binding protein n=1 Tax=Selenomonas sp. TaxID=2053611 RepID=UPI0025D85D59|nr:ATP-binding protein [Selenomonas sp.]MCR5757895.1 FIST C-terminal domain-containing protein [Selenomonas sp.]